MKTESYKIFTDGQYGHTIHHNFITGEVLKIGLHINGVIYICDDILEKYHVNDRGRNIYEKGTIGTVINGVTTWHERKKGFVIFIPDGTYHNKIKGKCQEIR